MKKLLLLILTIVIISTCITSCSNSGKLSTETMLGRWKMKTSAAEFISLDEDNLIKETFGSYLNKVDFSGLTLTFYAEFADDGAYLIIPDENEAKKEIAALYDAVFDAYDSDKGLAMETIGGSVSEAVNEQEFDDILSQHGYTYEEYVGEIKQMLSEDIEGVCTRYISEMKYGGSYFVEVTDDEQGSIYFDEEKTRFATVKYAISETDETIELISSNMPFFSHSKQLIRAK